MSKISDDKRSGAIPRKMSGPKVENKRHKPVPNHATTAEQLREAEEARKAAEAEASIRDRMVDIGRGNQQAGRQGQ